MPLPKSLKFSMACRRRVGIGDVQATLDDSCRDEHVVIIVHEIDHNLLQLLGRHLAVSHSYSAIRHMLTNQLSQLGQLADAVVDEEHLSASAHLELDGFSNDFGTELAKLRLDGIAVGGRRLDDAQVPRSHQGELQRSRYRGGCQGEGVDIGFQLTELLFCRDTELLLFVNNKETQVLEMYCLADELMRTDDDIDGAILQVFEHLFCLLRCTGTRQIFYSDGKVFQAALEGLVVLICQHGSRHENSHLLVVDTGLESSSDSYFRLAKADVAADEPIHRSLTFHIGLDVLSGFELVGRIFVEETCLEFVLHETVTAEGKAFLLPTTGVEQDEVAGDVLYLLLRPLLHALPSTSAKTADARRLAFLALVLGNLVQGMDGDIDIVVSRICYLDDFLQLAAILHLHQSSETTNAIVDMNHIISYLELLQFLERQCHLASCSLIAAEVVTMETVEYLMVGEDGHLEVVVDEAGMQSLVDRGEPYARLFIVEDTFQTVRLLLAVGQDVEVRTTFL